MSYKDRTVDDVDFVINEGPIIGGHSCHYLLSSELRSIDPVHFGQIFEPTTTLFFLGAMCNLPKDFVMLDIGANIGYYSLLCAVNRADSKVYSFEPHSKVFEVLDLNADKYENFYAYNCGITPGEFSIETLYCDNRNVGGHSFLNKNDSWGDNKGFQEDIGMYRMDCELHNIRDFDIDFSKIAVVKIDTQGMEVGILKDMYDLLPEKTIILIEDCKGLDEFSEKNGMKNILKIGIENVYQK